MMNGFGTSCTYLYFVFIDLGMTQHKITLGSSFFKEHKIGDTAPYFGRAVKVTIFFIDCLIHMLTVIEIISMVSKSLF